MYVVVTKNKTLNKLIFVLSVHIFYVWLFVEMITQHSKTNLKTGCEFTKNKQLICIFQSDTFPIIKFFFDYYTQKKVRYKALRINSDSDFFTIKRVDIINFNKKIFSNTQSV
jgi:hypothetical protein